MLILIFIHFLKNSFDNREWMFLYVLVEDIKNRLKLVNNTHFDHFWSVYFGDTHHRPQQVETELWLTDPLLKPDVGDVLDLGVSRRES